MTDPQTPLRIVLVEDSADDAELIERALRDGGLVVVARVVEDEAGLRAELTAFGPEVVIIDWKLPAFSGAGAVALTREWDPRVPCILISGSIGEELVVEALRTGATDYVLKRRLEKLAPAVRRALDESVASRDRARLETELASSQAAMRGALDAMTDPFAICTAVRDADGAIADFTVMFANRAAGAFFSLAPEDSIGQSISRVPVDIRDDFYAACVDVVETRHGYHAERVVTWKDVAGRSREGTWIDIAVEPFNDGFFVVFRDVTERMVLARERDRLAAVVEDSIDGITLADRDGLVVYANAAFKAQVDLPVAGIIGQPMPIVVSSVLEPATIAEVDAAIRSGSPWRGEVDLATTGGQPRRIELAVSPRADPHGVVSTLVTVMHDVTDLREAQADLARHATVRSHVVEVLRSVREDTSLEQSAQMICDNLVTLPGIDQAAVDLFLAPDELLVVGLSAPSGFPLEVGDWLPSGRAALIYERLKDGAWAWYSTDDETGDAWATRTVEAGLRASAYGPIVFGDELVGVLVIGTYSDVFARALVEKMPGVVSFSTTSSGLLALRMQAMRRGASLRRSLEAIIAAGAFHPVFQPIVDLETRDVLGYEALTRFDSEQRPDLCFADAQSVGLGLHLEKATIEAALASASSLPSGVWLSLNVSPGMLAEAEALHSVLRSADRPLVIEVTEHDQISDYSAVRDSVRRAGPSARLAVDDAGVGVANFSHIIDLRPDFVKLDISLVRGISNDLGRQAMVVGLQRFAKTSGCRLIAEGVETEQEAATLNRLGVEFGQGYLFGRPEPVEVCVSASRLSPGGYRAVRMPARERQTRHARVRPHDPSGRCSNRGHEA